MYIRSSVEALALKATAVELGFNLVGIAPAAPSPRLDAYFQWIEAGMYGEMGYMARADRLARRRDLNVILPGVRSIILVGLDYHALHILDEATASLVDPARGRIAAYAWGYDYHDLIAPKLEMLAEWLQTQTGSSIAHKVYVDTGAILERSHAQQAGIGFIGKNTMLINPRRGSFFFLGEILTTAEFDDYDPAHQETMCGNCMRCQVACPTHAFPRPYVLDARRCISYLTIEHKGWIDRNLRPLMGNWVYGCDVCQDVCPFSRFVVPTHEPLFIPTSIDRAAPPLLSLLTMNDDQFHTWFAHSPILRIKRERLVRNACIAAGNWGSPIVIEALKALLEDDSPLIRGHAVWALGQVIRRNNITSARSVLEVLGKQETDQHVRDEIAQALEER